ncbi:thioredoxin domain-containing protein [Streptomyces sp. NPDC097610]|uniref:thioredoxin domain-containing protein n=1 Tax=Streptomyces sp. NPDC097610 TaxID=3157227 RepID=UPI0033232D4D
MLADSKQLTVVMFSAFWSGTCRAITPVFERFANTYSHVTFCNVDIDELESHPVVRTVQSVPHFRFRKNGATVADFSGANEGALKSAIEANI